MYKVDIVSICLTQSVDGSLLCISAKQWDSTRHVGRGPHLLAAAVTESSHFVRGQPRNSLPA